MKIQSARERLLEIVGLSYKIFQARVVNGTIGDFENEASMQLQFGVILQNVGRLYEWDAKDKFSIIFEKKFEIEPTFKSPNGIALCDIYVEMRTSEPKDVYKVGIEVKNFPKIKGETTTDHRIAVLADVQNLEAYYAAGSINSGFSIVYTTNTNYSNKNTTSNVNIGQGMEVSIGKSGDKEVKLHDPHYMHWNIYHKGTKSHCFLKVEI